METVQKHTHTYPKKEVMPNGLREKPERRMNKNERERKSENKNNEKQICHETFTTFFLSLSFMAW